MTPALAAVTPQPARLSALRSPAPQAAAKAKLENDVVYTAQLVARLVRLDLLEALPASTPILPWQSDVRCYPQGRYTSPSVIHLNAGQEVKVGRHPQFCTLVMDSPEAPQMISRMHARLVDAEGSWLVTDEGSTNGLLVNEERLSAPRLLKHGDIVTFGRKLAAKPVFEYIFEDQRREMAGPAEEQPPFKRQRVSEMGCTVPLAEGAVSVDEAIAAPAALEAAAPAGEVVTAPPEAVAVDERGDVVGEAPVPMGESSALAVAEAAVPAREASAAVPVGEASKAAEALVPAGVTGTSLTPEAVAPAGVASTSIAPAAPVGEAIGAAGPRRVSNPAPASGSTVAVVDIAGDSDGDGCDNMRVEMGHLLDDHMARVAQERLELDARRAELDAKLAELRSQQEGAEKRLLDLKEMQSELVCSICQDWVIHASSLECGHMFCRECIDRWLAQKKFLCPVCRAEVKQLPVPARTLDVIVDKTIQRCDEKEKADFRKRVKDAEARQAKQTKMQRQLEHSVKTALAAQKSFFRVDQHWSTKEKKTFNEGVKSYICEAREAYCQLVGLTVGWVHSADDSKLNQALHNLGLAAFVSRSEKEIRQRLLMFLHYG